MKLSRSEFLVLREILRSRREGVSNRELAKALADRLSHQGLADALNSLMSKTLIYRDALSRTKKGVHAVYKPTAASLDAVFLNDVAEFVLSKDTAMIPLPVAARPVEANCLYPSARLASAAKDPFTALDQNENLAQKLSESAQLITSAWLDYRLENYSKEALEIAKEYEDALATYLRIFGCQMTRWVPGAVNEPREGRYNYLDPLDMVQQSQSIDWPLKKYHITEEALRTRQKDFPNAEDELGTLSVKRLQKLKTIVYDKRKKRTYEEYLKSLVPPKTLMLLDFGLSAAAGRKFSKGAKESYDGTADEEAIGYGYVEGTEAIKSAFQEAREAYGRKEPAAERAPAQYDSRPIDLSRQGGGMLNNSLEV